MVKLEIEFRFLHKSRICIGLVKVENGKAERERASERAREREREKERERDYYY